MREHEGGDHGNGLNKGDGRYQQERDRTAKDRRQKYRQKHVDFLPMIDGWRTPAKAPACRMYRCQGMCLIGNAKQTYV